LVQAFVQQGGSDLENGFDEDGDSYIRDEVDGTAYVHGFYRIGDLPKEVGSNSHFEQILYPERFSKGVDDDVIVSPQLAHGIPEDTYQVPDHLALVQTHGKKTRLTHLFRHDERGMLLNALRRMRVVDGN